jgi:hypothetical protein
MVAEMQQRAATWQYNCIILLLLQLHISILMLQLVLLLPDHLHRRQCSMLTRHQGTNAAFGV